MKRASSFFAALLWSACTQIVSASETTTEAAPPTQFIAQTSLPFTSIAGNPERYQQMLQEMVQATADVAKRYGNPPFTQIHTNEKSKARAIRERLLQLDQQTELALESQRARADLALAQKELAKAHADLAAVKRELIRQEGDLQQLEKTLAAARASLDRPETKP